MTPSPQWRRQGSKVGSTVGHASPQVTPGALKMQDRKMQEWKMPDLENIRLN